jgi:hypothetical protein
MPSHAKKAIAIAALLALAATSALADCPELIGTDCSGGYAWFGLRHDNANIGQGQSFLVECPSTLLGVEIVVRNTGNPNGGVPPMVAGDPIYLVIADMDFNTVATSEAVMPWDVGEDWVEFEFDDHLEAGSYFWLAHTDVPRQASIAFCPDGDNYADGQRYSSLDGLAGPWFPNGDGIDNPFWVHLLPDQTPAESETWSAVKALY